MVQSIAERRGETELSDFLAEIARHFERGHDAYSAKVYYERAARLARVGGEWRRSLVVAVLNRLERHAKGERRACGRGVRRASPSE